MYQPTVGRFLSIDPLSADGVDVIPNTGWFGERLDAMREQYGAGFRADGNLYRYCANNPVRFVDPSGLQEKLPPPEIAGIQVDVCVRPIRGRRVGGHVYILVGTPGAPKDVWSFSGGPLDPDPKCKGLTGKQLQAAFVPYARSLDYPKKDEIGGRACKHYFLPAVLLSKAKECLNEVLKFLNNCCIDYVPFPLKVTGFGDAEKEGCNSNCAAYWAIMLCFGAAKKLDMDKKEDAKSLEPPPDRPGPIAGWGTAVPKCFTRAKAPEPKTGANHKPASSIC
jgi:RHS repeat-associated protein